MLMDRHWNVLESNEAAPLFFGRFVDLSAWPGPRNLLELMFDPAGMRPFIRDWDRVSRSLIGRLHREAIGQVLDARGAELLATLQRYPGAPTGRPRAHREDLPMIPLAFEKDGMVLSYFSMVATVGTPTTVAAQELRVECMFPADAATERAHLDFMAGRASPADPARPEPSPKEK